MYSYVTSWTSLRSFITFRMLFCDYHVRILLVWLKKTGLKKYSTILKIQTMRQQGSLSKILIFSEKCILHVYRFFSGFSFFVSVISVTKNIQLFNTINNSICNIFTLFMRETILICLNVYCFVLMYLWCCN